MTEKNILKDQKNSTILL